MKSVQAACGAPRAEPVAPFRDPWGGIWFDRASTVSSAEPLTMLSEVEALSEAHGQRPWPESKGRRGS